VEGRSSVIVVGTSCREDEGSLLAEARRVVLGEPNPPTRPHAHFHTDSAGQYLLQLLSSVSLHIEDYRAAKRAYANLSDVNDLYLQVQVAVGRTQGQWRPPKVPKPI